MGKEKAATMFTFNSKTTYDSIYQLLNAKDKKERDDLTRNWKDNKLQELNFTGVVAALLANVLTSTGSWPNVLESGTRTPWTVRACWFIGIVFSLASVTTAAFQSIRLHRLSCRQDGMQAIRKLLSQEHHVRAMHLKPQLRQVIIWQMSVMWLILSAIAMIAGMFILVWTAGLERHGWSTGQMQLAIAFTSVTGVVIGISCWEHVTLFSEHHVDDCQDEEGQEIEA